MKPPLCVVSSWVIRVYNILVWNTFSGSFNLDICFYNCLILLLIFHLKVLINFFFFFFIIVVVVVVVVLVVLLLSIIYTINLPVVWPRSCRVIYYFDTPALGRRHQSFDCVNFRVVIDFSLFGHGMRKSKCWRGINLFFARFFNNLTTGKSDNWFDLIHMLASGTTCICIVLFLGILLSCFEQFMCWLSLAF